VAFPQKFLTGGCGNATMKKDIRRPSRFIKFSFVRATAEEWAKENFYPRKFKNIEFEVWPLAFFLVAIPH
jgi:hypothetical protein